MGPKTKIETAYFRRVAFSSMFKSRVSLILAKVADLRVTLNLDGTCITSTSHTHPSYSQTSRLLTSSLSLGVPVILSLTFVLLIHNNNK